MRMESDFVTRKIKQREYPLPLLKQLDTLLKQLDTLHQLQQDKSQKPAYPYDEKRGIIRLPKSIEQELRLLAQNGKKAEALKRLSELTGASLIISKDYIDTYLINTLF